MAVTFTPNDVRSLPRLTGRADVNVVEVLSQFRLVVGFRAKAVAPHDEKSEMVLVLRCINNLWQEGITDAQTLSTPRI